MSLKLFSKEEVTQFITQIGCEGQPFEISLGEDICFGDNKWVKIGTISLKPTNKSNQEIEIQYDEYHAVKFGGFEWRLPTLTELNDNISGSLESKQHEKTIQKTFREGLQDVIRRTLLLLPVFDIETIAKMPLRKPITIVPDTSAVQQGALDFICRFFIPWARIKVPAIVHMEILTQVDNYLGIRWNEKNKAKSNNHPSVLRYHLLSQGGQRTLLRIELNSDTEMERGDFGADPLRGVVTSSSDPEDKALNLQQVTRSFADRLIVETARRVQTQVRPDHPLALLTSDQGMARMAMAEGIEVFFFQSRAVPEFAGKILTGTLFHPFKREIYTIALTDVLWELAVAFGGLRLHNSKNNTSLKLWGIGGSEAVTWQPLCAKDDLLWGQFESKPLSPDIINENPPTSTNREQIRPNLPQRNRKQLTGAYSFSPDKMLQLINQLADKKQLTHSEVKQLITVENDDYYAEYQKFLYSGQLIDWDKNMLIATTSLSLLNQALIKKDYTQILACLREIPSFRVLHDKVCEAKSIQYHSKLPISNRTKRNYLSLGEAAGAWLVIENQEIIFTTLNLPKLENFIHNAISIYHKIRTQGETEWILTGQWLEEFARQYYLHPVMVKELLEPAQSRSLLRLYAEGSTPDTRFEKHRMSILKVIDGKPQLDKVFLYHGDFLIPGVSTVRLKIPGVTHAA
jgi:hypothetical protein